jgi:hypothetical protein
MAIWCNALSLSNNNKAQDVVIIMGPIKHILPGIIAIAGIFFVASFSSCKGRDFCESKLCRNNSKCESGICKCPTGVYGVNCEQEYRSKYAGEYTGLEPTDTFTKYTDRLTFSVNTEDTSNYNIMAMHWIDTQVVQRLPRLRIDLRNHTSTGSGFYVHDTLVDGFKVSGFGTINGQIATMKLSLLDTFSGTTRTFTFNNYLKQP